MGKKDWKRIRPIVSPTFSAKKMRTVILCNNYKGNFNMYFIIDDVAY